ncbi:hypothetical protein ES705_36852 [subsurface metagenome]
MSTKATNASPIPPGLAPIGIPSKELYRMGEDSLAKQKIAEKNIKETVTKIFTIISLKLFPLSSGERTEVRGI